MALWYNEFDMPTCINDQLTEAKLSSGLELEVTGMMGKRLHGQTFATAQLTLSVNKTKATIEEAASEAAREAPAGGPFYYEQCPEGFKTSLEGGVDETNGEKVLPQNVLLEESEVMETTRFEEGTDRNYTVLSTLDQAIVLAMCINVENENPLHGLTNEQMRPYIERVIEDGLKGDWTTSSNALLLRSRLERQRPKTVERSILQLQVLSEQFHDANPSGMERLRYLHVLDYPTHVRLEKVVGEGFLALNANKSALEIFERLELWSLVIECHGRLGDAQKAETICREQLEANPTPEMYCNLGDILPKGEGKLAAYQKSWDLSEKHYARAMRSIGQEHFQDKKYEECCTAFKLSLDISPMYPKAWLWYACAQMRLGDLDKAAQSFLRVVSQVPDDGETWNNLGAVFLRLEKKEEAFKAFEQAIKHLNEKPKVWQNLLYS